MSKSQKFIQAAAAYNDKAGAFMIALELEMMRARRFGRQLSVVSILANARTGDPTLATQLTSNIERRLRKVAPNLFRALDFWGRAPKGGFIVALPETGKAGAEAAVDRIVATDPFSDFIDSVRGPIKILLGFAELSDAHVTPHDLIEAAVKAATDGFSKSAETDA